MYASWSGLMNLNCVNLSVYKNVCVSVYVYMSIFIYICMYTYIYSIIENETHNNITQHAYVMYACDEETMMEGHCMISRVMFILHHTISSNHACVYIHSCIHTCLHT